MSVGLGLSPRAGQFPAATLFSFSCLEGQHLASCILRVKYEKKLNHHSEHKHLLNFLILIWQPCPQHCLAPANPDSLSFPSAGKKPPVHCGAGRGLALPEVPALPSEDRLCIDIRLVLRFLQSRFRIQFPAFLKMPAVHLLSNLQNCCCYLLLHPPGPDEFVFYFKSLYCSFHRVSGGSKIKQMCSICYIIQEALL